MVPPSQCYTWLFTSMNVQLPSAGGYRIQHYLYPSHWWDMWDQLNGFILERAITTALDTHCCCYGRHKLWLVPASHLPTITDIELISRFAPTGWFSRAILSMHIASFWTMCRYIHTSQATMYNVWNLWVSIVWLSVCLIGCMVDLEVWHSYGEIMMKSANNEATLSLLARPSISTSKTINNTTSSWFAFNKSFCLCVIGFPKTLYLLVRMQFLLAEDIYLHVLVSRPAPQLLAEDIRHVLVTSPAPQPFGSEIVFFATRASTFVS